MHNPAPLEIPAHSERFIPPFNDALLENFVLELGFRPGAAAGDRREILCRLLFRKQALALLHRQETDESLGFQANGDLRYQLLLFNDGGLALEKAYERRSVTLINDDGKEVHTVKDFNKRLAEGTIAWNDTAEVSLTLTVRRNRFTLVADGREILSAQDPHPYPPGYCTVAAGAAPFVCSRIGVSPLTDDIRIADLEPTPLMAHGRPLQHLVRLRLANKLVAPLRCHARIELSAGGATTAELGELQPGEECREMFIPDVEAAGTARVELWAEGDARPLATLEKPWRPQRKWRVFAVVSAHEDLGYCDFITHLPESMADYLDMTRRICDSSRAADGHAIHRYSIEHIWWLNAYRDNRPAAELRRLIEDYIKPGLMEVMAVHSGTHTHWNDYEQLARSTYDARRELPDRWGLAPVTAFYADTPGISWAVVAPFAQAGIRYLMHCRGGWRGEGRTDMPDIFYWQAPNGKDRLLYHGRWGYTDPLHDLLTGGYARLRERIEAYLRPRAGAPYDALCAPCYQDHELPNVTALETIQSWRSQWAYPDIRLSLYRDYFAYMEDRYADRLPTLSGDINDSWGDYAAIDPTAMGQKRNAAAALSLIEPLAVLARQVAPGYLYPRHGIAELCHRLMEFDEHCWATMLPPTLMNILNNDIVKQGNAVLADALRDELTTAAISALAGRIARPRELTVIVWNPRPHPAGDLVEMDLSAAQLAHPCLVDLVTGQRLRTQAMDDKGTHLFFAGEAPPCGYRAYAVTADDGAPTDDWAAIGEDTLTTPFYRIGFDRKSGTIASIYDRQLDVELLDQDSPYRFNQFLFVTTPEMCSPAIAVHPPPEARLEVSAGPLAAVIRIAFHEPKSGADCVHEIRCYRDVKRIDIANRYTHLNAMLYEGAIGKSYGDIGNRYLSNVFYAFPFAVPDFRITAEMAGGVMDLAADRLPAGVKDFVMAQHWIDISNPRFGVALFTREAPTVHCGAILYNRFLNAYTPEKPHLFVYAASNRMAGLSTRSLDDCAATFHFSICSHAGDWANGGVPQWSWGRSLPLLGHVALGRSEAGLPPAASGLISLDVDHVQMTVLKHAERPGGGLIVRLVETHGRSGPVRLKLCAGRLAAVWLANIVEDNLTQVPVIADHECALTIAAFDFLTLRLVVASPSPGAVSDLTAHIMDAGRIALAWSEAEQAAGYDMFRSPAADGPLIAAHWLGHSAANHFIDDQPPNDRDCYYRVAPTDGWNNYGQASVAVCIRGGAVPVHPPLPVCRLRVIAWDEQRLILWWPSSAQAARYEIHRGMDNTFPATGETLVAVMPAAASAIQYYVVETLAPDRRYHYAVCAVDGAGRKAAASPIASGRTLAGARKDKT